jgi:type VI secretion system secreted protein Hcp
MAMVDYFLKIDGIKGESQDSKHKDEIQLLSWSWAEEQAGKRDFSTGGGGIGRVRMEDFQFTMYSNVASPKLMLACATGDHIKQALLTCRKAGKEQQEYLKLTLSDVLVSSYKTNSGDSDNLPMDSFSLNFSRILIDYRKQDQNGQLVAGTVATYDLREGRAR